VRKSNSHGRILEHVTQKSKNAELVSTVVVVGEKCTSHATKNIEPKICNKLQEHFIGNQAEKFFLFFLSQT